MAKYEEVFEDTQTMFADAIDKSGLNRYANITVLANNKAKEITKISKANDLFKFKTGDDICIIINEKIFEKLTPEQQLIVVEESIAGISFDSEKDKIDNKTEDFKAFSGILRKYGFETIDVIRESIKSLYQIEKDQDDQRKAETEKGKGKSKFSKV